MANSKIGHFFPARPGYFLVRQNGQVVPLIAADELPVEVTLDGISRTLEIDETVGMLNLGVVRSPDTTYRLVGNATKSTTEKESSLTISSNDPLAATTVTVTSDNTLLKTDEPVRKSMRPKSKTSVCRHWAAYGTCKWGDRCRNLHVMPTLHEAGLFDRAQNPGMFNVLRRGGPLLGKHGKRGMIQSSRQSVIEDGMVVRFADEDVLKCGTKSVPSKERKTDKSERLNEDNSEEDIPVDKGAERSTVRAAHSKTGIPELERLVDV